MDPAVTMTSVAREAGARVAMADVEQAVVGSFGEVFGLIPADVGQLVREPSSAPA